MRAEFSIKHREIDVETLESNLIGKFGPENREALKNSEIFSAEKWHERVLFAREDPIYRMLCFQSTNMELQVHVEPVQASAVRAAESVWDGVREALRDYRPKLSNLELVSGREFLSGRTGYATEFRRNETIVPVAIAVIVVLYSLAGVFTFARPDPGTFLLGAVSGIVAGVVAGSRALVEGRRGVLRWEPRR